MPKTNGEPPRVEIPQKGTKPLLVVTDDDGQPVLDLPHYLAWHKATGTFYVGGSKPRVYLKTRDQTEALWHYREWLSSQKDASVEYEKSWRPTGKAKKILEQLTRKKRDVVVVTNDFPEKEAWKFVREQILQSPTIAAKNLGIPEIARLSSLPKPQPTVRLSKILDAYLSKRKKPSEDELKKVKGYWNAFVSAVAPAKTVRDIDAEALTRWEDKAYAKYNNDGSPKTLAHRFEYVQRLFNYAIKKQIDTEECKRVVAEIVSAKTELPDLRNLNPNPISVDSFHALLDSADERWKAILLTALNLCYYPVDIRTIPQNAIDFDKNVVIFDRNKTGQTTRVGILWKRTKNAIQDYLRISGHKSDSVFITQYRTPYTAQGLRTAFRFLRDKTDVDRGIELAQVRDGAYSAAIEGGTSETIAKILGGHTISGMSDAYIKRNPRMVTDAVKAIEKHFFGNAKTLTIWSQ